MPKPKITFYVDIVSPFAYIGFYALQVGISNCYWQTMRFRHLRYVYSSTVGIKITIIVKAMSLWEPGVLFE
jgi:hypothetical protein